MNFPIEKYKFYTTKNTVIAASTYCGKTVKAVAKTDPRDEFDLEKGKNLAAARCNAKISKKRMKRAEKKVVEAQRNLDIARKHYERMANYLKDSKLEYSMAEQCVNKIESNM